MPTFIQKILCFSFMLISIYLLAASIPNSENDPINRLCDKRKKGMISGFIVFDQSIDQNNITAINIKLIDYSMVDAPEKILLNHQINKINIKTIKLVQFKLKTFVFFQFKSNHIILNPRYNYTLSAVANTVSKTDMLPLSYYTTRIYPINKETLDSCFQLQVTR